MRESRVPGLGPALFVALAAMLWVGATPALAATITVETSADVVADDGVCSLREALANANLPGGGDASAGDCEAGAAGQDAIVFAAGTNGQPILLTGGQLTIGDAVRIDGNGPANTIVDGQKGTASATRVLQVNGGVTVELEGLTIQNGSASSGGGIANAGTLTVTNSALSGNSASAGDGGGIFNDTAGTLTVTNSTLSGNVAQGTGPGTGGGGIGNGGGLPDDGGTVRVTHSTLSGNESPRGSSINNAGGGVATLRASILANDNPNGLNCIVFSGTIDSDGFNISDDDSCSTGLTATGDRNNVDPLLGALADNGGPTQTHALQPGSPAIDAVTSGCPPPNQDQRGVSRPQGAACDVGAFELQGATPSTPTPTPTPTATPAATPTATPTATATPTTPRTLTFYLHGRDVPGTAGGFTMNDTPPPTQLLALNLLSAPRWFGDPPLTGTFGSGATFTLVKPCALGLAVAPTYALALTDPDGGQVRQLGQRRGVLGVCVGREEISIPVDTPFSLTNRRLRLTVSTAVDLNLNLQLGSGTFLRASNFSGN